MAFASTMRALITIGDGLDGELGGLQIMRFCANGVYSAPFTLSQNARRLASISTYDFGRVHEFSVWNGVQVAAHGEAMSNH
jgi:hypothetical protein